MILPKPLLSHLARSKRARDFLFHTSSWLRDLWWAIEEADVDARAREATAKRRAAESVKDGMAALRDLTDLAEAERAQDLLVPRTNRTSVGLGQAN